MGPFAKYNAQYGIVRFVKRHSFILLGIGLLFFVILFAMRVQQGSSSSPIAPSGNAPTPTIVVSDAPKEATLEGEYTCLPHTDTSGPQTMECALGLKTDDGSYYALDFGNLLQSGAINFGTGTRIRVSGLLVPIEQISSNQWQKYPIKGILQVKEVSKI